MKIPHLISSAATILLAFSCYSATAANPAAVRSPSTFQTYADNSVSWQQLRWLPGAHELVATLTLSNMNYVSDGEPRHDETFNFPLPGVEFDPGTGTFSVRGRNGRPVPVATLRQQLFVKSIALLPGAQLQVTNHGGQVGVTLLTGR
jgi:hypothetical protein